MGFGLVAATPSGFYESLFKKDKSSLLLSLANGFKTPLIVGFSTSAF
jgi:hypothetical protein